MAAAIYDEESRLLVRDDMKRTTKTQREMKTSDVFDFSFVRKANEDIKTSGWMP